MTEEKKHGKENGIATISQNNLNMHTSHVNSVSPPEAVQSIPQRARNCFQIIHKRLRTVAPAPKLFGLFHSPNMRKKTLLILLIWFANQNVFVGLTYVGPQVGNSQYLGFFLTSAIELVSYIPCWLTMDHYGRRFPMIILMVVGGIFACVTILLPKSHTVATMLCFLVAKMAVCASFLIIYPYAGELFPTELRAYGFSLGSYFGMMGLIVIPFIVYLGVDNLIIPIGVMGLMLVIGGLLTLLLPETLGTPLPQSIEEAEAFGKGWDWKTTLIGWQEKSAPKGFRRKARDSGAPLI
ncbi:unnamed protein product [Cyprideis torosa]|uniref:Uncharacterized protein n=1 Tax=Cyprideis torosa TaxID=163714 RepID=A0A7R8WHM2_9CRUS|nr:unnamed protein product [Cyprideis torosa]CAG0899636.1 unnamed protein product [Cyprideis torosa]